jgi:hypothetical protein
VDEVRGEKKVGWEGTEGGGEGEGMLIFNRDDDDSVGLKLSTGEEGGKVVITALSRRLTRDECASRRMELKDGGGLGSVVEEEGRVSEVISASSSLRC